MNPILIAATPTAFDGDGSLDICSTQGIYEHTLGAGVDAVFVNGTTGEFAALSRDERRSVIRAAVDVAGAERVIAHVGAASPWETRRLAEDAAKEGVYRVGVITPYFMPTTTAGVTEQLRAAKDGAEAGSEVSLYLFPDRTGVDLTPAQAAEVITELELAGAKVSIPGTSYVADLARAVTGNRTILSGNDAMMHEVVTAGGAGVVSGVSSATPRPFVALAKAINDGIPREENPLADVAAQVANVLGPSIANLKWSLRHQGIIAHGYCRMAIEPPTRAVAEQIRETTDAAISDSYSLATAH